MPDTAVSTTEWYRRLLIRICAAVFVIVGLLLFLPPETTTEGRFHLALGSVLLAALLAAWLGWRHHVRAGALILALVMFLSAAYLMLRFRELRDVLVGGQVAIILFVSLFWGKRAATGWAAANVVLIGGLYGLERGGWIPARVGDVETAVLREIAIILFSALLIRWWTDSAQRQVRLLQEEGERRRSRFAASPVALMETDCSQAVGRVRFWQKEIGVADLRSYFHTHPQEVARLAHLVRVRAVNDATLKLYEASEADAILGSLDRLLPLESYAQFVDTLLQLANGRFGVDEEMVHQTLTGKRIDVTLTCAAVPGYETSYERVMLTVQDVTARKQAQQERSQYTERIELQQKIDHAILTAESPSEIARAALQQLRAMVPFWSGGVVLFDLQREEFEILTVYSLIPLELETGVRYPISNPAMVFDLAQQPYHLAPTPPPIEEEMLDVTRRLAEHGVETFLYVPLVCQNAYVGLMALAAQPGKTFQEEQIEIVREAADPLAIAIHNANTVRAETAARRRAETLQEVAALLNKELALDTVLEQILARLTEVVAADNTAILLLSEASLYLAAYQNGSQLLQALAVEQVEALPNVQAVIRGRKPVIVSDTSADPSWKTVPGAEQVRSWMGIPLLVNDQVIGLFSLDHHQPRFYTEAEAELALPFADHAALVIEKVRLFHQMKRHAGQLEQRVGERTRELEALYRVTAVTVEHLDLRSILRSALGRALSALDGSAGAIHLKSDAGWRLQAQHGLSPSLQRTLERLPASHSLFSRVAAHDEPYLFTPASEPPLPANAGWQDFQTHVGAPMHAEGEVVGIFSVFGRESLPYTVEEIALIASIADQVGVAVGNAALHREAEEAAALRERQQLSRDLHDSVTQTLYSIKLYAEATQANTEAGEWEKAAANGEEVTRLARQAMREMRLLLYQLQEGETLRRGLYAALRERLQMVEERGAIEVTLSQEEIGKIPVEVEQALFGAAQEALNNVVKHSEATAVSVRLLSRPHNHVSLIIEDNGKGFLPTRHSPGMGLDNMRHRLLEIGGAVALSAQPEMGAQVHFQVQLE